MILSNFPNDVVTLWKHQESGVNQAVEVLKENNFMFGEFAFIFDVGTGKTGTLITTLRKIFSTHKRIPTTLICSPVITLENWANEWSIFSKVDEKHVIVLKGPVKKRIKTIEDSMKKLNGECIFITNYEGIRTKDLANKLVEIKPEILVCDESHRAKTHNSKTTKVLNKIADETKFRYILTGTLITNSEFDIFSQWRILDKGKSFGRNFYHFRNKYFYDNNAGMPKAKYFPDWRIRSGSHADMDTYLKLRSLKAIKEDCIDLPDLVEKTIKVDPTPEQKRVHNEIAKKLIAEINEGVYATAENALTKTLRLAQVSSGFIKTEDDKTREIKNDKVKALKELLFDLCVEGKEKVIVWAVFKHNYEQIRRVCDALNIRYKEGHGGVRNVFQEVSDFNDGDYSVLIGNPSSIGIGVNIKSASTSISFSQTFSLEQKLQKNARNYRGGSVLLHSKITRISLVTKGTIDELIEQALEKKLTTANKILDLVKNSI